MLEILTDMQKETYCVKWYAHHKRTLHTEIQQCKKKRTALSILHILYTNIKHVIILCYS